MLSSDDRRRLDGWNPAWELERVGQGRSGSTPGRRAVGLVRELLSRLDSDQVKE
jgi:hypothetical protein